MFVSSGGGTNDTVVQVITINPKIEEKNNLFRDI